jgi:hypothetical protein
VDTLTHMDPALATTAVKHAAVQDAHAARHRHLRLMDDAGLAILEQVTERARRGHPIRA